MSQENVEIVRRALAAFARGDPSQWLEKVDPEIRVYPRPDEPGVQELYEGLTEYLENWFGQWDDYRVEPVELIDAGTSVVAVLRERGRMEKTDIEVEEDFTHSFALRDGKVVEWRHYGSHEEALEALGLRE